MTGKKLNKVLALALAIVLSVGLLPTQASAATITFTDVPTGAWYYADVTHLANSGIIDGVGNNRFAPESNISYAEMVKLIINSCFRSEYEAYENAHYNEMSSHFSGTNQKYWYSFMCYYAKQLGLLNGPSALKPFIMDIDSYASCYTPMTRYDMAQILTNALKLKGIEATAAEKESAAKKITDYVPVQYQSAVQNCFALQSQNAAGETKSLLEGSNGYFNGENNMTRAQACAVIIRLQYLANTRGTTSPSDPGTSGTPTTPAPTEKEITVKTESAYGNTTKYSIVDNGFTTGYLNNGKEINEANINELLLKAKEIWPQDMAWGEGTTSGDSWYYDPSTISGSTLGISTSVNYACGGFAAMLSDYLFGKANNPARAVTNFADLHPGDVIFSTTRHHAMIVIDKIESGTRAGAVYVAEGNSGSKVNWASNGTKEWSDTGLSQYYALTEDYFGTYTAYTRWPTSGTSGTPNSTTTPSVSAPNDPQEIAVTTTSAANNSTAYHVADNGFATGYLNNGKEINEANVKELLLKAKEIGPDGMIWTDNTTSNNNWYFNPGSIAATMLNGNHIGLASGTSPNYACGGFAAMISDYLFGKTNNPIRKVTNFSDLRPGDVIYSMKLGTGNGHAMVIIDTIENAPNRGFAVYIADGNRNNNVSWGEWPNSTTHWNAFTEDYFGIGQWVAYTRYPA